MAQFYEQCKNKGYTNMRDDTQSLKAKVIATDLGLRYGNIVEFYEAFGVKEGDKMWMPENERVIIW